MQLRVAELVPDLARHVDVEVPGHLRVLVGVAGHQLGSAELGVHQRVEEVALLLALDRDVVLVGVVDVELPDQERVALGRHLDELVAGGLLERRQDPQRPRLHLEPDRQRAEVVEDR
jgi:hypothetical protein